MNLLRFCELLLLTIAQLSAQGPWEAQIAAGSANAHAWRGLPQFHQRVVPLSFDLDLPRHLGWRPLRFAGLGQPRFFAMGMFDHSGHTLLHRDVGLESVILDRRNGRMAGGYAVEGGVTWSETRAGATTRKYREIHVGVTFDDLRLPSASILWDSREGGLYAPVTCAFPLNIGLPLLLEATVGFVSQSPKLGRLKDGHTYTGLHDGQLALRYQRNLLEHWKAGSIWLQVEGGLASPLGARGREAIRSLDSQAGQTRWVGIAFTWRFTVLR